MKEELVELKCDDNEKVLVFSCFRDESGIDFEFAIQDSYCGGDYKGILGRFKRALKAFLGKPVVYILGKPVVYTGVYKENGKNEVKEFLEKCLKITEK